MAGKIKILDKKTINQIAAGEVIERPASVVKELLENAIDANATKIVIELELAGKKLVRVTDNGDGIPPEDIKLAFEKHSTSKIQTINDVYNLKSLGFRGEALASIAAVAWVECITSDGSNITGKKIVLDAGVVRSLTEIGCAKGTTIKVKDLFYNLPARLKHLKSNQTELAHIIEAVTHIAIYYHEINFKLIHDGNEILNLPGTRKRLDNLVNIYGKEIVRNLIPLSIEVKPEGSKTSIKFKITGYIGKPSITRSDTSYQSIFVNGRYVENRTISNAIKNAYHTLVMKHRYPFVILFIDITSEAVDVNTHPTKLKVRFENEELVYNQIFKVINDTLRSHDLITEAKVKPKPQTVSLKAITTFGIGKPGYMSPLPEIDTKHKQPYSEGKQHPPAMQSILKMEPKLQSEDLPTGPDSYLGSVLSYLKPLGQILDTYIIAQGSDRIVIIDQHAASERIMYERIKQRYNDSTMSTQELLEPVELELSPKELGLLKTNIETFRDLNFLIDELGNNNYFVKGIPIILGRLQSPEFIHDIINDLIIASKEKEQEIIKDKMIQIMACKSAIKAGKPLTIPEMYNLIRDMDGIENPYHCAHGRPTIISISELQLKKMFKRIV